MFDTTREWVEAFVSDPNNGLHGTSPAGYRETLCRLLPTPVDSATQGDLVALISSLDVSDSSKKTYMTKVKGFYDWAHLSGLIEHNPAQHLPRLLKLSPQVTRMGRWLDEPTVKYVLDQFGDSPTDLRMASVLRLGFTVGLRRSEIASARWENVELRRGELTLHRKGGKVSSVYLGPPTVEHLRRWRGDWAGPGPIVCAWKRLSMDWADYVPDREVGVDPKSVSRMVRDASSRVGVPFAAHDMRRTFAGLIYDRAGVEKASEALDHANIATTMRYLEKRTDRAFQASRDVGLAL